MNPWHRRDLGKTIEQLEAELAAAEARMLRFTSGTDRCERARIRTRNLRSLIESLCERAKDQARMAAGKPVSA